VYRSHSGHFGLVNSEEGYQSLQRFLFGDFAVTVSMTVDEIVPPDAVTKFIDSNNVGDMHVGYLIETDFGVRGLPMLLNSRNVSEESAIFRTHKDLIERPFTLLTTFLMLDGKVDSERPTLGFSLRLTIRMPEVEIDGVRYNDGYEGSALYSDRLILELVQGKTGLSGVRFGWDQETPNQPSQDLSVQQVEDGYHAYVPFSRDTGCHIKGMLTISARPWNAQSGQPGEGSRRPLMGLGGHNPQADTGSQTVAG
jgi:hypothetical protein